MLGVGCAKLGVLCVEGHTVEVFGGVVVYIMRYTCICCVVSWEVVFSKHYPLSQLITNGSHM